MNYVTVPTSKLVPNCGTVVIQLAFVMEERWPMTGRCTGKLHCGVVMWCLFIVIANEHSRCSTHCVVRGLASSVR